MSELLNILLNLAAGLLPEKLTETEVKILEKEYGWDWFNLLGYSEPEYKKPEHMGE